MNYLKEDFTCKKSIAMYRKQAQKSQNMVVSLLLSKKKQELLDVQGMKKYVSLHNRLPFKIG